MLILLELLVKKSEVENILFRSKADVTNEGPKAMDAIVQDICPLCLCLQAICLLEKLQEMELGHKSYLYFKGNA